MSDDDHPVPVTIRPATPVDPNKVVQAMDSPSRKPVTLADVAPTLERQVRKWNTESGNRAAVMPTDPDAPFPPDNERLPPDEIERLNTARKQNIERKKQMGRPPGSKNKPKEITSSRVRIATGRRQVPPKRDRHEPGEIAPDRPLELKSRLSTVLHITTQLAHPELVLFHDIMLRLEKTPRGARKRIIAALASVYP